MKRLLKISLIIVFSIFSTLPNTLLANVKQCQLVKNITGYTPVSDSDQIKTFNWLAFQDGKVLATGTKQPTALLKKCKIIDGKNQFVLPGLIDAHGHVSGLGTEMLRINLRGVKSEALAAQAVKEFADKNPQARWVLGRGWNQVLWFDKSFPTKKSLDALNIDRPIFLRRIDGHSAWANSAALKIAGIDRNTPDPEGGKIIRDEKGEATGVLIDLAMGLVDKKIPPMDSLELEYAFDKAYAYLLSLGVVSVHDAGIGKSEFEHYLKRQKENRLPIRIYGMLSGSNSHLFDWLKQGYVSDKKDMLSIRSVKIYSDGALGSRGAAMLAPYSDDADNKGLLLISPKNLDELVLNIIKHKFQVNVHAIGDRGNRVVLNAIERAFKKVGGQDLRHRVEHAQVVSLEDIPRFKTLNIIASIQPVFATSDMNMASYRIGRERLKGAYAWKRFLDQGTVIASGSDFPVELANPFFGLHAAVTRQDRNNQPENGWLPKQKITSADALRSFTLNAAYAAHQENVLGSLEKGKWADFIIIDHDVINGKAEDIWKSKVLQTWIGGEKRFEAK